MASVYTVSPASLFWLKHETHNPKDAITGDEMFSIAFPIKEVDNVVYEVVCQMIQVRKSSAVGAYWPSLKILVSLANRVDPLTEKEEQEQEEEGVKIVNNIVHTFGLQETTFTKHTYLSHLKGCNRHISASTQLTR